MASSALVASRTLLRSCGNNGGRRNMTYYIIENFKVPTMNDLPVPAGSWQIANAQKQAKMNALLGFAVVLFAGTVTFAKTTGLINFHWGPAFKN